MPPTSLMPKKYASRLPYELSSLLKLLLSAFKKWMKIHDLLPLDNIRPKVESVLGDTGGGGSSRIHEDLQVVLGHQRFQECGGWISRDLYTASLSSFLIADQEVEEQRLDDVKGWEESIIPCWQSR